MHPILENNDIHIWTAHFEDPESIAKKYEDLLSEDEKKRASKLIIPQKRYLFMATRVWLRKLLGSYLQQNPADIKFKYNPHGKPILEELYFNVSHSNQLAVYAFSQVFLLGIDVEYIQKIREIEGLAEKYFLPQEYLTIKQLPEPAKSRAFYQCWTRKEAYLKAKGTGFSDHFPEMPDINTWSFFPLELPQETYVGTLAVQGSPLDLRYFCSVLD